MILRIRHLCSTSDACAGMAVDGIDMSSLQIDYLVEVGSGTD